MVEGDAFHRYDRARDARGHGRGGARRERPLQPLRPRGEPVRGARGALPRLRRDRRRAAAQATSTTRRRRRRTGQPPGTFTPWADVPRGHRPPVLRGAARRRRHRARGRRAPRRPARRRRAHREPRVDPEDPPRQGRARLLHRGGGRHDPAPHAGLRALHLPAVLAHARQLPARAHGGHLEPLRRARHPHRRRELRRDPLPRPAGHRLPLPAHDAARLVHVARRTASSCRAGRWRSRCRSSSRR